MKLLRYFFRLHEGRNEIFEILFHFGGGQQKLARNNLSPYSFFFNIIIHTQKQLMSFDNILYGTHAKCVKPINIILYFHNKTQLTVHKNILDMRRTLISGGRNENLYLHETTEKNQWAI